MGLSNASMIGMPMPTVSPVASLLGRILSSANSWVARWVENTLVSRLVSPFGVTASTVTW